MSLTPIHVVGTLPDPRLVRLNIRLPGKATLEFEVEAVHPNDPAEPVIPAKALVGLYTKWKLVRKVAQKMDGWYMVRWVYEAGLSQMPFAPDDPRDDADRNYIYGMDCTLQQQPLTMHPRIGDFLCTYGGTMREGELIFPSQDPTGTSTRSAYDQNGNYIASVNPFYGVDSYLAPMAVLNRTFMSSGDSLPLDALHHLGYINLPPKFPFVTAVAQDGKSANWLKGDASCIQHGIDLEITESWLSGGFGGWRHAIYDDPSDPNAAIAAAGSNAAAVWAGGDSNSTTAGGVIA